MKVLLVNYSDYVGSTGKIVSSISNECKKQHIEVLTFCLKSSKNRNFLFYILAKMNSLVSHVFGNYGFEDFLITCKLIKFIKKNKPDIIHLHNIHSHDFNIRKLFIFLNKLNVKIIWTFHDCWAYTGYCPYYLNNNCEKWKTGCGDCSDYKKYSFFVDRSFKNLASKKETILLVKPLIVVPSKWLYKEVKKSFLKNCDIRIINNGINHHVFRYRNSRIKEKLGIQNKKIILGVAYIFDDRKGINDFIELSKKISDDYVIVLVGKIAQKISLPENIVHLERTENQIQLSELYSAADYFVNPTKEDNYPTTHLEALSCGTPVITYDVGGAAEMIDEFSGIKVRCGDVQSLFCAIKSNEKFDKKKILSSSRRFNEQKCFDKYIRLYKDIYMKKE